MATTPRKKSPAASAADASAALSGAGDAELGSNLGENLGDDPLVPDEFRIEINDEEGQPQPPEQARADLPPEHAVRFHERIWIVLEDNDDIPPGGQFIGVDGAAFSLKPGIEAWVPVGICDVLDQAVKSIPVVDENTRQIIGYKDRLRFPYRIVRNKPAPAGWKQPR
jgi:hypothetical protein